MSKTERSACIDAVLLVVVALAVLFVSACGDPTAQAGPSDLPDEQDSELAR